MYTFARTPPPPPRLQVSLLRTMLPNKEILKGNLNLPLPPFLLILFMPLSKNGLKFLYPLSQKVLAERTNRGRFTFDTSKPKDLYKNS